MNQVLNKIDAVILCGGLGRRLRSVIGESQKTMATVGGRPFLEILLNYLARQGLRRAILCTGYQAEQVEEYFQRTKSPLEIEFSHESEPLGTGGAVKQAQTMIRSSCFFVLNGDSFCQLEYKKFLAFHRRKKAVGSIAVSQVADPRDFGSIVLDKDQRIVEFKEKMANCREQACLFPAYVNAGVYFFTQDVFKLMPSQKKFSLEKDFFHRQCGKEFFGFEIEEKFFDIGTPERYERVRRGT